MTAQLVELRARTRRRLDAITAPGRAGDAVSAIVPPTFVRALVVALAGVLAWVSLPLVASVAPWGPLADTAYGAPPGPSSIPNADTWITNGRVYALAAAPDGKIYLGGAFDYVGPRTDNGVAFDATSGARLASFPRVHEIVWAAAPDGHGGFFIGGDFDKVGGLDRLRLAHIRADGAVDPEWNPGANGRVHAIAVSADTVYVGGSFADTGGKSRYFLAALDGSAGSTGAATSWNPNPNSRVEALAVSGSTVYAGGVFTSAGGKSRRYLAALSASDGSTGTATSWDPNPDNPVRALVVSGSTVYAGGAFRSIGGKARNRLAAFEPAVSTTGTATGWDPDANAEVLALAVGNGVIYAGGDFDRVGTNLRYKIAAIETLSATTTTWNPQGNGTVRALAVSGSTVYVGGAFTSIGGKARNRVAAFDTTDGSTGAATAWDPGAGSAVNAIAVSGTSVFVGGNFASMGGVTRHNLAAIEHATGGATAWDPNANGGVLALNLSGATLYVGGEFTSVGGQPRNRIAALDVSEGATGTAAGWNPNANGEVMAIAPSGAKVYVGGEFTNVGGQSRKRIAALDGVTGAADATWNPNCEAVTGAVYTLAVSGSTVYAGGYFYRIGGKNRAGLAALDASEGSTGTATDWNAQARSVSYQYGELSPRISALALSGSVMYVGGQFTEIGGRVFSTGHWSSDGVGNLAALDITPGSTGTATSWAPNASADVLAIVPSGASVLVGGRFFSIGGAGNNGVAQVDAGTGKAASWYPYMSYDVNALAVHDSSIYVGGDFPWVGGGGGNLEEDQTVGLARFDWGDTPPKTTVNTGWVWPNSAGWYRTAPAFTLVPDEMVTTTQYSWDAVSWYTYGSTLTASEGRSTLYYYSADTANLTEAIRSRTFKVDTVAPFGTMALNTGAAVTNSLTATVDSTVDDTGSGMSQMKVYAQGGYQWFPWIGYTAHTAVTLPAGDGTKTVTAQYTDMAGNMSERTDTIRYLRPLASLSRPTITYGNRSVSTVRRSWTFTIWGTMRPKHSGRVLIRVYRRSNSRTPWRSFGATLKQLATSTKYYKSYRITTAGSYFVKAYHEDSGHRPSWSSARYFTVK